MKKKTVVKSLMKDARYFRHPWSTPRTMAPNQRPDSRAMTHALSLATETPQRTYNGRQVRATRRRISALTKRWSCGSIYFICRQISISLRARVHTHIHTEDRHTKWVTYDMPSWLRLNTPEADAQEFNIKTRESIYIYIRWNVFYRQLL